MMDNSKKHGTNANFAKSGMNDKNGAPLKAGAPGFFGNLMKGKGALGLLNPLGALGSKLGLFGKKGKPGLATPPPPPPPAPGGVVPPPVDPDTQAGPIVDPNATPVVDPNAGVSAAGAPPVS